MEPPAGLETTAAAAATTDASSQRVATDLAHRESTAASSPSGRSAASVGDSSAVPPRGWASPETRHHRLLHPAESTKEQPSWDTVAETGLRRMSKWPGRAARDFAMRSLSTFAVSVWVGGIFFAIASFLVAVLLLPHQAAMTWIAFEVSLMFVPLSLSLPGSSAFCRFAVKSAEEYWGIKVKIVDESAIKEDQAYVIGYEPHSAMPVAMPTVFHEESSLLPESLRRSTPTASSAMLWCPFMRHFYYWLGIRSVSRSSVSHILSKGRNVVINPGGAHECMEMAPGKEVIYLRKRRGFVRAAMTAGVPLIPCFAFGQSAAYNYWRLGPPLLPQSFVSWLSHQLKCLPMLITGRLGTPIPYPSAIHVVIGKPIAVPRVENPSREEVQKYLDVFIESMYALFEQHKSLTGHENTTLQIL